MKQTVKLTVLGVLYTSVFVVPVRHKKLSSACCCIGAFFAERDMPR